MTAPSRKSNDQKAREVARRLRRDTTKPEQRLWSMLRDRRLGGLKFRRQQSIKPFFVDFYCGEASLIVELDGMSHVGAGLKDDRRTVAIGRRGYRVIRVTNDDVLQFPDAVADYILRSAREASPSPSESSSARERVGESSNPGEGASGRVSEPKA
jgi:very-short-patch-repair endonuclease